MLGYTMLGLAALAKGPVGLILPLIVVHVWWLICHRLQQATTTPHEAGRGDSPTDTTPSDTWGTWLWQQCSAAWNTLNPLQCFRALLALRTIPGVLLSLLAAAPWYIAVGIETNGDFLRGFFLEHNVGRALGSMEGHNGSLLFYPVAFLVGTFPWSMWVIPVVLWCVKASRDNLVQRQMVVLSAVWIGVYMLAFSAASTKLPSYITPCYAGAALAIGGYLRQFEGKWFLPAIHWRRTAAGLAIALGVAISVGILVLSRWEAMPALQWIGLSGIALTLAGVACLIWERMERVEWVPATWLCAAVAFQIILFGFGTSIVDRYRGDLQLLANVQKGSSVERDWISIGGLEPSWVMYLGKQVEDIKESQLTEKSWQQVERFWERKPDGNLIVVGASMLAQVQERYGEGLLEPIASGNRFLKSGHVHVLRLHSAEAFQAYLQHRSATHSLLR